MEWYSCVFHHCLVSILYQFIPTSESFLKKSLWLVCLFVYFFISSESASLCKHRCLLAVLSSLCWNWLETASFKTVHCICTCRVDGSRSGCEVTNSVVDQPKGIENLEWKDVSKRFTGIFEMVVVHLLLAVLYIHI